MDKDPISPKAHGAIDYGFLGLMLAAPSLLGLTGPARTLCYLFGGAQGIPNALTDQPYAVERLVPFRTHGTIELASGLLFVALPVLTGAVKDPKARNYFLAAGAMLAAVYILTDWDATDTNA
ncbi:MAG: hypothetical protein H0U10_10280 [Chloroflexia bacterium]|nr:hypothetical protein [Chloroflexia bacterium]